MLEEVKNQLVQREAEFRSLQADLEREVQRLTERLNHELVAIQTEAGAKLEAEQRANAGLRERLAAQDEAVAEMGARLAVQRAAHADLQDRFETVQREATCAQEVARACFPGATWCGCHGPD